MLRWTRVADVALFVEELEASFGVWLLLRRPFCRVFWSDDCGDGDFGMGEDTVRLFVEGKRSCGGLEGDNERQWPGGVDKGGVDPQRQWVRRLLDDHNEIVNNGGSVSIEKLTPRQLSERDSNREHVLN